MHGFSESLPAQGASGCHPRCGQDLSPLSLRAWEAARGTATNKCPQLSGQKCLEAQGQRASRHHFGDSFSPFWANELSPWTWPWPPCPCCHTPGVNLALREGSSLQMEARGKVRLSAFIQGIRGHRWCQGLAGP